MRLMLRLMLDRKWLLLVMVRGYVMLGMILLRRWPPTGRVHLLRMTAIVVAIGVALLWLLRRLTLRLLL